MFSLLYRTTLTYIHDYWKNHSFDYLELCQQSDVSAFNTLSRFVLVAQLCLTLCDPVDCSHQAPLSMGFSGQKYRRGLPFPSAGDLPNPGIEPMSLMSSALADRFFTTEKQINIFLSSL